MKMRRDMVTGIVGLLTCVFFCFMTLQVRQPAKLLEPGPRLLPFVARSSGGIRQFRESDIEWLRVIGCMKKAGMSIKDIRQYLELSMQGNNTIDTRLAMFRHQREVLQAQMDELQHILRMVEYKCWYYETAQAAGTVEVLRDMPEHKVPEQFRAIRQELKQQPEG